MDSYGFLQIPMDSYGFVWIAFRARASTRAREKESMGGTLLARRPRTSRRDVRGHRGATSAGVAPNNENVNETLVLRFRVGNQDFVP